MSASQESNLLDRLAVLLQQQIELARKSDYRKLERLTKQTDQMVHDMTDSGEWDQMDEDGRQRLTTLYRALALALAGAKDQVDRQVRQMSGVRRTLDAYRLHG